jgi:cell division protease FtsH
MSGFYTGDGVIVMAATNRLEALDPALLRPGRFDRQIEVGLPGKEQRLKILKLHSRGKPLSDDVSLEELAAQTVSFSGASLENLLNEAALTAAEKDEGSIGWKDLQQAFYRSIAGADHEMLASPREKRIIAVHESGHALASRLLSPENRLTRVSILPAGHGAAGYNLCIPQERVMVERRHLENQIQVLLAGRAAEQLLFGDDALTAGASSDLARAAELAGAMVTELGMWDEPAVSLKALNRACGACTGAAEACKALLRTQYACVKGLLASQMDALNALSEALLEAESLDGHVAAGIIDAHLSSERPKSA